MRCSDLSIAPEPCGSALRYPLCLAVLVSTYLRLSPHKDHSQDLERADLTYTFLCRMPAQRLASHFWVSSAGLNPMSGRAPAFPAYSLLGVRLWTLALHQNCTQRSTNYPSSLILQAFLALMTFIGARTRMGWTTTLPGAGLAGALDHHARTQVAGVQVWRDQAALVRGGSQSPFSAVRRAELTTH